MIVDCISFKPQTYICPYSQHLFSAFKFYNSAITPFSLSTFTFLSKELWQTLYITIVKSSPRKELISYFLYMRCIRNMMRDCICTARISPLCTVTQVIHLIKALFLPLFRKALLWGIISGFLLLGASNKTPVLNPPWIWSLECHLPSC